MKKSAATRMAILQKAFDLIYANGYQTTSIDDIIANTEVTKGAFYYHFKTKDEMGLALINEIMFPSTYEFLIGSLKDSQSPAEDVYKVMKTLLMDNPYLTLQHGCPAGNLTQEISHLNHDFGEALLQLTDKWEEMLKASISNGKKAGKIRKDVNAQQVAYFVMSGYWGIRNIGKLHNDKECYKIYLKALKSYLNSLK